MKPIMEPIKSGRLATLSLCAMATCLCCHTIPLVKLVTPIFAGKITTRCHFNISVKAIGIDACKVLKRKSMMLFEYLQSRIVIGYANWFCSPSDNNYDSTRNDGVWNSAKVGDDPPNPRVFPPTSVRGAIVPHITSSNLSC
jgi:hypothetical protein